MTAPTRPSSWSSGSRKSTKPTLEMYKSPDCGQLPCSAYLLDCWSQVLGLLVLDVVPASLSLWSARDEPEPASNSPHSHNDHDLVMLAMSDPALLNS